MTAAAADLRSPGRPLPWELSQLVRLSVWTTVALVVVLAGWLGVSGQAALTAQFAWASLCILGLVISGLANIAWLLAGRRALGVRLAAVTAQLTAHRCSAAAATAASDSAAVTTAPTPHVALDALALVASTAMTRFHGAGCPLVRGKDVTASSRAQHQRLGRSACPVCAA